MTHVFIVDDITFDIHLKYMFAGTGTDDEPKFLNDFKTKNMHHMTERNLVALIADISRVKIDDKILFYLQGNEKHSGTIFGIFKVEDNPFYCSDNDLNKDLKKKLQYRVLIEEDEVYAKGISEYTALDSLQNIEHPSQMCWSLIYRKLRGNRGCTMITDYEAERLKALIKNVNSDTKLTLLSNKYGRFSYDSQGNCISIKQPTTKCKFEKKSLDITKRLLFKMNNNKTYETHLQAYIMQHININNNLKQLLVPNTENSFWIGNEVGCGVGMQKIDILIMQLLNSTLLINIIELKCINPNENIFEQLKRYVDWIKDYICPLYKNHNIQINPIIIAPFNKNNLLPNSSTEENITINKHTVTIEKVKYINILKQNDNITFEELT